MQATGNTQNPNKSLSIRVCTDGLSFCVYAPSEAEPYKYITYKVNHTISLAANLKQALLNEPVLQEEYQRVNVLVTTPKFTTVPVVHFKSEEIEDIFNFNFPERASAAHQLQRAPPFRNCHNLRTGEKHLPTHSRRLSSSTLLRFRKHTHRVLR